MKVLFIIDHLDIGGVQEFLANYALHIPSHQVTVASLAPGGTAKSKLVNAGANVIELGAPANFKNIFIIINYFISFIRLRSFLKEHRHEFDVIHVHLWRAFFYASLLRLYRYPNVTAALACDKRQMPASIRFFYWLMARRFRYFFVHAPARYQFGFLRLPEERLLDQPYFVTKRQLHEKANLPGDIILITAGRLIPQKGHDQAILLARRMRKITSKKVVLAVVGDGVELNRLKEYASEDGPDVIFLPATPHLDPLLACCHAFVKFALGEGVNSLVRECLCAGMLVASTLETPECESLVNEGLMVPLDRHDLDCSAQKLLDAIQSRDKHDIEHCALLAKSLWDNDSIRAFYEALDFT